MVKIYSLIYSICVEKYFQAVISYALLTAPLAGSVEDKELCYFSSCSFTEITFSPLFFNPPAGGCYMLLSLPTTAP